MQFDLSIIIPAYNEEHRIEPTLVTVDTFLARMHVSYEIVVVDDGSTDDTTGLVERLAECMTALRCISTRPNRGKGHAVRVGMLAARGKVRLLCDADGSIPPYEIPTLVARVMAGEVDIAIGSRYVDGSRTERRQPFYRRWWSRLANQVVQRTLVGGIRDTQCGFKAFTAEAADAIFGLARIDGWAFDLEVLALARRMGYSVAEIGVVWSDDPRSRISPLRDAWNVFRELLIIRGNFSRGLYGDLHARPRTLLAPVSAARSPAVS